MTIVDKESTPVNRSWFVPRLPRLSIGIERDLTGASSSTSHTFRDRRINAIAEFIDGAADAIVAEDAASESAGSDDESMHGEEAGILRVEGSDATHQQNGRQQGAAIVVEGNGDDAEEEYDTDNGGDPYDAERIAVMHQQFLDDDAMMLIAISNVEGAIVLMPDEEKAAYLTAKQRVPHLVSRESSAAIYLQGSGYNPWLAARRLVSYWHIRVSVFGPDRAYMPMRYCPSGNCAVRVEDLTSFIAGRCSILPSAHSATGRPVVYFDLDREVSSSIKAAFLLLQHVLETLDYSTRESVSGIAGFMFLAKVSGVPGARGRPRDAMALVERMVRHALPMKPPDGLVLCQTTTNSRPKSWFVETIIPMIARRGGPYLSRHCHFHAVGSEEQGLTKLQERGYTTNGLPILLGGAISDDQLLDWLRQRGYPIPHGSVAAAVPPMPH